MRRVRPLSRFVCSLYLTNPNGEVLTKTQLHGDAQKAATEAGVQSVQVSISHSDTQAIAVAIATLGN
jgi:phosphopantetheinyl transferase (holo-ACP synthase)